MARRRRRSPRNRTLNNPQPPVSESLISEDVPEIAGGEEVPFESMPDPGVAKVRDTVRAEESEVLAVRRSVAKSVGDELPRVLAVFPDSSVLRLIRESISAFTGAVVDTTPDAAFGFEMAMQRDYRLFFFGVEMPVLDGERLYDFVAKAYEHSRPIARRIPAVVYLSSSGIQNLSHDLTRDARVKGVLSCPFEIARLLRLAEDVLPIREVGA